MTTSLSASSAVKTDDDVEWSIHDDHSFIQIGEYHEMYSQMAKWFKAIQTNKRHRIHILIVTGSRGCGKTCTVAQFNSSSHPFVHCSDEQYASGFDHGGGTVGRSHIKGVRGGARRRRLRKKSSTTSTDVASIATSSNERDKDAFFLVKSTVKSTHACHDDSRILVIDDCHDSPILVSRLLACVERVKADLQSGVVHKQTTMMMPIVLITDDSGPLSTIGSLLYAKRSGDPITVQRVHFPELTNTAMITLLRRLPFSLEPTEMYNQIAESVHGDVRQAMTIAMGIVHTQRIRRQLLHTTIDDSIIWRGLTLDDVAISLLSLRTTLSWNEVQSTIAWLCKSKRMIRKEHEEKCTSTVDLLLSPSPEQLRCAFIHVLQSRNKRFRNMDPTSIDLSDDKLRVPTQAVFTLLLRDGWTLQRPSTNRIISSFDDDNVTYYPPLSLTGDDTMYFLYSVLNIKTKGFRCRTMPLNEMLWRSSEYDTNRLCTLFHSYYPLVLNGDSEDDTLHAKTSEQIEDDIKRIEACSEVADDISESDACIGSIVGDSMWSPDSVFDASVDVTRSSLVWGRLSGYGRRWKRFVHHEDDDEDKESNGDDETVLQIGKQQHAQYYQMMGRVKDVQMVMMHLSVGQCQSALLDRREIPLLEQRRRRAEMGVRLRTDLKLIHLYGTLTSGESMMIAIQKRKGVSSSSDDDCEWIPLNLPFEYLVLSGGTHIGKTTTPESTRRTMFYDEYYANTTTTTKGSVLLSPELDSLLETLPLPSDMLDKPQPVPPIAATLGEKHKRLSEDEPFIAKRPRLTMSAQH